MSPRRPLRNTVCGNVLICGALAPSANLPCQENTNLSPGNYGSFFLFPSLQAERVLPDSGVEKTASVTHQLQLPFLCDKAHTGPRGSNTAVSAAAGTQRCFLGKKNPIHFTKEAKGTYKGFGEAHSSNYRTWNASYHLNSKYMIKQLIINIIKHLELPPKKRRKKKSWLTFWWNKKCTSFLDQISKQTSQTVRAGRCWRGQRQTLGQANESRRGRGKLAQV